jgi:hypothetical protein
MDIPTLKKVSFIHEFGIGILELTYQKHRGLCGVLIVFFQMAQMVQLIKCSSQLLFTSSFFVQCGTSDSYPYADKLRRLFMLRVEKLLLCHDENRTIQCKPPLLSGSLHDGFSLSVIGDPLYIDDFINGFEDFLFSPG